MILELLRVAMVGNPNTKGFIVDGFPREMEQGKEFENEVCEVDPNDEAVLDYINVAGDYQQGLCALWLQVV